MRDLRQIDLPKLHRRDSPDFGSMSLDVKQSSDSDTKSEFLKIFKY